MAGQALGRAEVHRRRPRRPPTSCSRTLRTKDGRLLRTYGAAPGQKAEARLNGYLDDYAFLVHGLLCLHDATGDKQLARRGQSADRHDDQVPRRRRSAAASSTRRTITRSCSPAAKDQYDGAQPSGNSVAARNLVRLWVKTGDAKYETLAEKTFKALAGRSRPTPSSLTTLTSAIGLYLDAAKKKMTSAYFWAWRVRSCCGARRCPRG